MRSGKGVASSPEPRSVLWPGIWLRIVLSFFFFFFTPADCSEVGLEQSLERRGAGESLHRGWIYLHIAGRRDPTERGWCKAAITEFRCVLSLLE